MISAGLINNSAACSSARCSEMSGAPKRCSILAPIGWRYVISPVFHSRLYPTSGANPTDRMCASSPRPRITFIALGFSCRPAPIQAKAGACSYMSTLSPILRRVAAAVSPAIPAPTIAIAGVASTIARPPWPGSIRLDAGRLGDLGIQDEFVLDQLGECGPIERHGIKSQSDEPLLQRRTLQRLGGLLIDALDDGCRGLRRCEQAGPEIVCGLGVARL